MCSELWLRFKTKKPNLGAYRRRRALTSANRRRHSIQHKNIANDFPIKIQNHGRPSSIRGGSANEMQTARSKKPRILQTNSNGYKHARHGWSNDNNQDQVIQ